MIKLFIRLVGYYVFVRPKKGFNILKSICREYAIIFYYSRKLISCFPTTLIFRITSLCNLRCVQCGQWGENGYEKERSNKSRKELTTQEYKDLLSASSGKVMHIYFWGGEPLIRKDFIEIAQYAADHNFTLQMATNGTLLDKKAEELVKMEFDFIAVSLDGPEQINNSIRIGSKNSFQEALSGIRALNEAKKRFKKVVPVMSVVTTITEQNYMHLYETYETVRDIGGIDIFHLQFGIFTNQKIVDDSTEIYNKFFTDPVPKSWKGFIRDTSKIDPKVIEQQISQIKEDIISNQRNIMYRQTPTFKFDVDVYYKEPEKFINKSPCVIPWKYLQIMPDGELVMCLDFANTIMGNIRDHDLGTLWNNERAQGLRHFLNQRGLFPACSRCDTHLEKQNKAGILAEDAFVRIRNSITTRNK